MNNFLFTKIFAAAGLFIGLISASNFGVKVFEEFIGYSLPYLVAGAVVGIILDLLQKIFSKKDRG